ALHAGKAHAREFLIELLWPDTEPATGRNNQSKALSMLKRQLEPEGGKSLFDANHSTIQLNPEGIRVDAQRFEALVKRGLLTRLETAERHTALSEALALWAPPFPGIYDDWAIEEQERLEALAEQAREALESLPEVSVAETPIAATAPIVHSLPVAFSRFLGREPERVAIAEQLQMARLVTLLGPGGVGKTRLALEVARASQEQKAFTRVVFASLAELPLPSLILPTLRRALTDAAPAADPLAQLVTTINAIPGRVLILLDNLEHLLPAESRDGDDSDDAEKSRFGPARIVRALLESCPDLVFLATSRQPLGMEGEQQVALEPLVGATGVELFVDRARAVRPDFTLHAGNKAEIEAICTLLDGLPLAIELAAAWVRVLTLPELRERLEKEVLWLEGRRRDLNPRQKSLEATLRWSWQLLSAEQKRLLCALSVFRGCWTLDAVEAVHRSPDTLDLLYNLVDKSLVVVEQISDTTRFRLLETIRQFAWERLEESGEQERVQGRHLQYFLAFTRDVNPKLTGPAQKFWYERLEQENGNARTALAFGTTCRGHAEPVQALAGALMKFWWIRGYITEGRDWYEKVLSLPEGQSHTPARADALYGAGALVNFQAEYTLAEHYSQQSLVIRRALGDKKGIANALQLRGLIAFDQKNYAAARTFYEEGLGLRRELGDLSGLSTLLNN
ncbi:NACHT domain-containing protein, partial [Armatimonas sp.]|uniref:ATP-binding protein n=1 Tax=Armatimonas sp. TaxID=1872638 RepID=UPI00286A53DA